jgi:dephospho-CoA kinase
MLRVGLTGGLGSGKTTVSAMFATHGAHILSADEIGRELMRPGNPVFAEIVHVFGTAIVADSGSIDRLALARVAFAHGRIEMLNRIVHPAVIAEEEHRAEQIFAHDSDAVVIVESALIFEASRGENIPGWRTRFDKVILITAPDELKLERFVGRVSAGRTLSAAEREVIEADGRARIAVQIPDAEKAPLCDYVIDNSGPIDKTEDVVARIWSELKEQSTAEPGS